MIKNETKKLDYFLNNLEGLLMKNHDYKYGISDDELDDLLDVIKDIKEEIKKERMI